MAGSSNFKIFDENLVNIMDDTAYAASTYRTQGAVSGVAPSNVHNKLYRQTSILSAAIAEVAKNRGEVVSDADFNNLVAALTTAFGTELIDKNMWKASKAYVVGDIVDAPTLSNWAILECSVAGTTGTSEPTWGTTVGATITDNTVSWILKRKSNNINYGQQIYDVVGTYTFTAPVDGLYKVTVVGGGGGAGGAKSTSATYRAMSGGGGGAGCAIKTIFINKNTSITVTIGAGGIAGVGTTPTYGGVGGTSSFGEFCSATGGGGGVSVTATTVSIAAGACGSGSGTNGNINIRGGAGETGKIYPIQGGVGGTSYFCGGTNGQSIDNTIGYTGLNFGGGGGGAVAFNSTVNGGAGAGGIVIIEW